MVSIARDVISAVKISEVYRALTGVEPRRTRPDTWRGPATWRGGDGLNVSLNDSDGVWYDFRDDTGGGVLDLVVAVRGGSRQDALRWLADFAGVAMDDTPLSAEDRQRWAEERRALERDLPDARWWRRTAVALSEELLCALKSSFFDPTAEDRPSSRELQDITRILARLQTMSDAALVTEYRWLRQQNPGLTWGMVRWARDYEKAERAALVRYFLEVENART
jgi:hypothetical protein